MNGLWRDLTYAVRTLVRAPGFTLTAVFTLGLGIASSVAMFSLLDGILLRPLPYKNSDRLVMLWINDPAHGVTEEGFTFPTLHDWQAMNHVFDDIAGCIRDNEFTVGREGDVERAYVSLATYNLFPLLGVGASQGRTFTAEEDERGENVAVISHGLQQRRFGGGPAVGKTLRIDGRDYEVIGVMPTGFEFPRADTVAWIPWPAADPLGKLRPVREGDWLRGIARLKPGVTIAEARRDMDRMAGVLTEKYPPGPDFAGFGANVVPLLDQITGPNLPRRLWILLGAVGFVFLIACVNVMNLIVVRNEARKREMAIRESLGASCGRLALLRFTETALLSALALLFAMALAFALLPLIVAAAPASMARLEQIRIDWAALLCAALLAAFAASLAAFMPGRSHDGLLGTSRGSTEPARSRRLQSAFVILQVALSLVLLCGVGLFLRSLEAALAFDPGFAKEHVVLAEVEAPRKRLPIQDRRQVRPRASTALPPLSSNSFSSAWRARREYRRSGRPRSF